MIAGSVGMVAFAVAAVPLLRRKPASIAAVLALSAWFAVAALASLPLLVG
jgi:hypothetical protein